MLKKYFIFLLSTLLPAIALATVGFFLLFPFPTYAAENWMINSFDSKINVIQNGKVQITETIDVNFGTQKHGIYRDIPYIYYTEKQNNTYTEIQIVSVLQDNKTANYQSSYEGNFLRLKIGDPNRTIIDRHTYTIEYFATGVLRSFEDHDELYWDATGNGWTVPILKATATVTLPQPGILNTTCYQGVFGSTNTCSSTTLNKSSAVFSATRPLIVGEGITAVAGYTKGLVPILIVTPPPAASVTTHTDTYPPNLWTLCITFILTIGSTMYLWYEKGKEKASGHDAIVVEYTTPDSLRPAEVGTLLDERADTLDVSATIIDLAVRGFLKIEEVPKKWLFGSVDYILTRTDKDDNNLLEYEKLLLKRLFSGKKSVNLSDLKEEFYDDLVIVKKNLYEDVIDKLYFASNPETVKAIYGVLGGVMFVLGIILSFAGSFEATGNVSGIGIGLFLGSILLIILSRSFAKRTQKGHDLYRRILGFKMFIEKAEKYKQQYLERENIFSELLPYAIVFGATEKFANAFKVLGIEPKEPTWYVSPNPFNPYIFSSTIDSFSGSMTSAIASQPRSNSFSSSGSGFSSGGSSGGGFGGGGGGSW